MTKGDRDAGGLAELAGTLRAGTLSSRACTETLLERIRAANPAIVARLVPAGGFVLGWVEGVIGFDARP